MADMFGAPIGIGAAETDMRQNVAGALLAQKTLGEIDKQPAEKALTEAHARLYGAEADQKIAALAAAERMAKLSQAFAAKERAAEIQAHGGIPTVANMGKPPSLADRAQRELAFMAEAGMPESELAPYREKVSKILQQEASTREHDAKATEQSALAQKQNWERAAALARSVLDDPSQYPQVVQALQASGSPLAAKLPPVWGPQAARMAQAIETQGIGAVKKAELDIQEAAKRSTAAAQAAQVAVSEQRVELLKERTRKERTAADLLGKYGGEQAQSTIERNRSAGQRSKELAKANELKNWSPLPTDPKYYTTPGKGYSAADGSHWVFVGKDAKGEPLLVPAKDYLKSISDTGSTEGEEE